MASLKQIFEWFREGLEPSETQFKDSWSSFWHKSEHLPQTQVLGLNDNLNNLEKSKAEKSDVYALEREVDTKAGKAELNNIKQGLLPMGEVDRESDLDNIVNPKDGWAYKVKFVTDERGNPYIFRYTVIKDENDEIISEGWVNTKLVTYESEVAQIQEAVNPRNDDVLYVVDSQKNAIAKIDKNGLRDVNIVPQDDESFFITDKKGNVIAKISDAGLRDVNIVPQDGEKFMITDGKGHIIFKADKDGIQSINGGGGGSATQTNIPQPQLDADINLCFAYGQSLSVAGSSNTPVDMTPCLQFKNGLRVDYTEEQAADASFVADFYGNDFSPCAGTGFEGTMKRFMLSWTNLLKQENGLDVEKLGYQFIASLPGVSGSAISSLQKGRVAYTRLIQSVEAAKRIANAQNKTFAVSSLFWIQGESDYRTATVESYYNALDTLFTNLNADIKAITGQNKDVQFICYQPASHTDFGETSTDNVAMAILQMIKDKDNVHLGCAMYQLKYSDALHLQTAGYFMMGAMAGVQSKRILTDGKPMPAMLPKSWNVYNKTGGGYLLELKFDVPVKPLVFDISGTTYCNVNGQQPNMGFSLESVFNVSETYQKAGNGNYTATDARSAVPEKSRSLNRIIKYKTAANTWMTEKFIQGDPKTNDWTNGANWQTVQTEPAELINGVNITRYDTVVLSLTDDPRGLVLNYAKTGKLGGGNLRDSQGEYIKTNVAGVVEPIHNWAPIFKEII